MTNFLIKRLLSLPLTLLGFRASPERNTILLHWTSGNEQDPTTFEVQRSSNGTSFTAIATLNGKGKNQGADYSWLDAGPLNGVTAATTVLSLQTSQSVSGISSSQATS